MDNQPVHINGIDNCADFYAVVYYPDSFGSPVHLFMPEQAPGQGHVCLTIKPYTPEPDVLAATLAAFDEKRDKEVVFYPIAQSLASTAARKRLSEVHVQARDSELRGSLLVCMTIVDLPRLTKNDLPFGMDADQIARWTSILGSLTTEAEEVINCHFRRVERSFPFVVEGAGPVVSYISRMPNDTSAYPWCTREQVYLDTARNLPLGYRRSRRIPYLAVRNLEYLAECFKDLRLGTWYLAAVDAELCDVTRNAGARELLGMPEHYEHDCVTSPYFIESAISINNN